MLVTDILKNVKVETSVPALMELEVTDISADSRNVRQGSLFFAYDGVSFDSHEIAVSLYHKGIIKGIVAERELSVPAIIVGDGRKAFARGCGAFFGSPAEKLTTVAVTGTNGKTTTTWILEKILEKSGVKCIRIGTTGARVGGRTYELDNTTPSPYDFHRILAEGLKDGATVAVAEVSSHALAQDRLSGVVFDVAVYTNLTGDHLDYHKDLESYYQAKKRLFESGYSQMNVINVDNEYGRRLHEEAQGESLTYGITGGDLSVKEYSMSIEGIGAEIEYRGKSYQITSPLVGEYNLQNILAAMGAAIGLGIPFEVVREALEELDNIPGRLEKYSAGGVNVFVDYAHTDDALVNVMTALKGIGEGKLIVVFGAGGDRDKTKRPRMGRAVQQYADLAVVTSDNPRTEDPLKIIEDILTGMDRDALALTIEPSREKAIALAIQAAESGDMVLVAGKGHENYQIIGTVKHHFSDSEMVQQYLREK